LNVIGDFQKTRQTRVIRDGLDEALIDISKIYRDVIMVQTRANEALINNELDTEIRTLAEKTNPQSNRSTQSYMSTTTSAATQPDY
jgi:DNA polymerase-3 subunit delta'